MGSNLITWFNTAKNYMFMRTAYDPDYRRELERIQGMARVYGDRLNQGGPAGGLWHSVAQYRCQSYARGTLAVVLANIAAALALPFLLGRYLRPWRSRKSKRDPVEYLKINFHMAYVVPNLIRERTVEVQPKEAYLRFGDAAFAFRLFLSERALYPELLAKLLIWMASVRPVLDQFQPRMLIQYCEFSAHSSLRKAYLNHLGVGMANISHGEEVISCRNCFSSCDEYFAWEITPRDVHEAMCMDYGHLFHFNPCENLPRKSLGPMPPVIGVLWPSVPGSDLVALVREINKVAAKYRVVVRPHPNPNYAAGFEEHRASLDAEVSDAKLEGVQEFIDRCSVIAGYLSAVLLQVAFRGGQAMYIRNRFLDAIQAYHPYYQKVPSTGLDELADALLQNPGLTAMAQSLEGEGHGPL